MTVTHSQTLRRALGVIAAGSLVAAVLSVGTVLAVSDWTVAPATGGTNISSTTAANGGSGAWTTLTGPTVTSVSTTADLIAPGTKLTLSLPSNFEFNSNINITPSVTPAGCGLTAGPVLYFGAGFTSTNVSTAVGGTTGQNCSISFGAALQVRPTSSDPAAGTGGSIAVALDTLNLGSGGTLTMVTPGPTPAPTPTPTPTPTPVPLGPITLSITSPTLNNNAIIWGESYIDITTKGTPGTVFQTQATSDNVTWTPLKNSSGAVLTWTIGSSGSSTYRYTPIRNYWYRSVAGTNPGTSNVVRITVRQTCSISPSHSGTATITQGDKITFTTTSRPARSDLPTANVKFEVFQKNSSGAWVLHTSATKAINAEGKVSWPVTFSTTGSFYVRAQTQPTSVNSNSFWTPNQYYNVQ